MLFNSGRFLIFFPIVCGGYYVIPAKYRYLWLLVASYYFYMQWNPVYVFLLLFTTFITYIGGVLLEKIDEKKRKICLCSVIVVNLIVLGYFKYSVMILDFITKTVGTVTMRWTDWDNDIILPIGISFFTLQAIGYLIDVYRRETSAERNILRYALFVSFFPQLVAGPIERSKNLLNQLGTPKRFNYDNLRCGLLLMLYGYFLKIVIADRVAIFVDKVYEDPVKYNGFYLLIATVLFSLQIYCDFYGYSTIAKGVAITMGIKLSDNFNAPYYSKSIKEFWRRWHISLSTWFMDYLYIPLGGNRKGTIRKYINLMIVFCVSGLWHGADFAFMIWGSLHGIYLIIESMEETFFRKLNVIIPNKFGERQLRRIVTFLLVCFAWLFFRANNTSSITQLMKGLNMSNWMILVDQSLFKLGVTKDFFHVLVIAVIILGIVDYQKYKEKDVVKLFFGQSWWFRMFAEVGLLIFIVLFGCYGTEYDVQQFIYFQF